MKKIRLTQHKYALVDNQDFAWLSKFKWNACKNGMTYYARRLERQGSHRVNIHMHREIAKPPIAIGVDHRNGNGLDNRRLNLRPATQQQNNHHASLRKDNTSGYKGVCYYKRGSHWRAYISINQKILHIGYFDTAKQAAKAYDRKATILFGEFAYLNFPSRGRKPNSIG